MMQGGFSNGKFEGPGNLMYLVGDYQAKYQGKWNNGKMNGNGTYSYIDGRIYKGGWSDGVQVKDSLLIELMKMKLIVSKLMIILIILKGKIKTITALLKIINH